MASFFFFFPSLSQPISNFKKLTKKNSDAHGHSVGTHSSHGPETHQTELQATADKEPNSSDIESHASGNDEAFTFDESILAQMVGVGILEFGVLLHRCGKIHFYALNR